MISTFWGCLCRRSGNRSRVPGLHILFLHQFGGDMLYFGVS